MWCITASGREAWETQDASIPNDYRQLLWMIDVKGDAHGVQHLLAQHPEPLVRDWLSELEDLGFLERVSDAGGIDTTVPLALSELALAAGRTAADKLVASGAYLAENRRGPAKPKAREETAVLIVEDDPDQLALADLRVTMAGYQVRAARSIQEMTHVLLRVGTPDLLLLDIVLPDGNGFEVLSKLRRHPDFSSLPVVMLTALQAPEDIGRGLELGADGYVTKPYSKNVLVGVIAGVLE